MHLEAGGDELVEQPGRAQRLRRQVLAGRELAALLGTPTTEILLIGERLPAPAPVAPLTDSPARQRQVSYVRPVITVT